MEHQPNDAESAQINSEVEADSTATPERSISSGSRRFRWEIGLAILVGGALLELLVWNVMSYDRTFQVMYSLPIVSGIPFFFTIWWIGFSGVTPKVRNRGVIVAVAALVVLLGVFRIDGFSGEMLPIIKYRWAPSAQQKAKEYWASLDSGNTHPSANGNGEDAKSNVEKSDDSPADELPPAIHPGDWPGFRGAQRDGIYRGEPIQMDWGTHPPRELWRHPVGLGWSSFAVVDGLAFTMEQRGPKECVVCYRLEDGEQIWVHETTTLFSEAMGGNGPRSTPTFFDGNLYTLGANGDLLCLNAVDGTEVWGTNILDDAKSLNISWGMASSPLVTGDLVVVNPGSPAGKKSGRALIAYDRRSGNEVWAAGDFEASYCSPRIETLLGVQQILLFDGQGLAGHNPDTGHELWRFGPWTNGPKVNVAQPIVIGEDAVFIGSGYGVGATLLELSKNGGKWNVKQRWPDEGTRPVMRLKFGSAVYKDGFLYGIDERILACIDAATGEQRWRKGRYGYGQILLLGKTILVQAENGEVALVEASPDDFREITRFPALDGQTWNHPVVVGGRLLVRNAEEAACFDISLLPDK